MVRERFVTTTQSSDQDPEYAPTMRMGGEPDKDATGLVSSSFLRYACGKCAADWYDDGMGSMVKRRAM